MRLGKYGIPTTVNSHSFEPLWLFLYASQRKGGFDRLITNIYPSIAL